MLSAIRKRESVAASGVSDFGYAIFGGDCQKSGNNASLQCHDVSGQFAVSGAFNQGFISDVFDFVTPILSSIRPTPDRNIWTTLLSLQCHCWRPLHDAAPFIHAPSLSKA